MVANCSSEPVALDPSLPALDDATVLLGTHADSAATVLAPWESRILSL